MKLVVAMACPYIGAFADPDSNRNIKTDKMFYRSLLRPLLFLAEAEKAHNLTAGTLKSLQKYDSFLKLIEDTFSVKDEALNVTTSGITFPSPVGLAAGFDKNAELIPALSNLGFGFLEIGSVTAKAASGNPAPRMFRLPADQALINRMGLNNHGAEEIARRFEKINSRIPTGINIAKSPISHKNTDAAIQDYITTYRKFSGLADFITLNISCPNTSDGTTFEDDKLLKQLLAAVEKYRNPDHPLFIKFSADSTDTTIIRLASICESFGVDGYVAVNTTTTRNDLKTAESDIERMGKGGLSGRPLQKRSRECITLLRSNVDVRKTVISVGGIDSGREAEIRLQLGANLVQLYSGLVYHGPSLPGDICRYLLSRQS